MTDVFISCGREDADVARGLRQQLEREGYRCWMAPDDIQGSKTWAEQILEAIAACKVVVVLVSSGTATSGHVRTEVAAALEKGKGILQVRVEDVESSGALEGLSSLQERVDAFPGPLDTHIEAVSRALVALLAREAPHADAPVAPKKRRITKRRVIVVAGVVAFALAAAGLAATIVSFLSTVTGATPLPTPELEQLDEEAGPGQARWILRGTGGTSDGYPLVGHDAAYVSVAFAEVVVERPTDSLLAVDLSSGQKKWSAATRGMTIGTPARAGDTVYFVCADLSVYAVDADSGRVRWASSLPTKTGVTGFDSLMWLSSPVIDVAAQRVVVGTAGGVVHGLDLATGAREWSVKVAEPQTSALEVAPAGDGAVVAVSDWDCARIDVRSGRVTKRRELDTCPISRPVFYGGTIFLRMDDVLKADDGQLVALDAATLETRWEADAGTWDTVARLAAPLPAAGEGIVCCPADDGTFRALDAKTGELLWSKKASAATHGGAISQGVVCFSSENGRMYCVDARSGRSIWEFKADRKLVAPVSVGGDVACCVDTQGTLYAVQIRKGTPAP